MSVRGGGRYTNANILALICMEFDTETGAYNSSMEEKITMSEREVGNHQGMSIVYGSCRYC